MTNYIWNKIVKHSRIITLGIFTVSAGIIVFNGIYGKAVIANVPAGNPSVYGFQGSCANAANAAPAHVVINVDNPDNSTIPSNSNITASFATNFKLQNDQLGGAKWNCAYKPNNVYQNGERVRYFWGPVSKDHADNYQYPGLGAKLSDTQSANLTSTGASTTVGGFDCGWGTIPVSGTVTTNVPGAILESDSSNDSICKNAMDSIPGGKTIPSSLITGVDCSITCSGNTCAVNNLRVINPNTTSLKFHVKVPAPAVTCSNVDIYNSQGQLVPNGSKLDQFSNTSGYQLSAKINGAASNINNVNVTWTSTEYNLTKSETYNMPSPSHSVGVNSGYYNDNNSFTFAPQKAKNGQTSLSDIYQYDVTPSVTYSYNGKTYTVPTDNNCKRYIQTKPPVPTTITPTVTHTPTPTPTITVTPTPVVPSAVCSAFSIEDTSNPGVDINGKFLPAKTDKSGYNLIAKLKGTATNINQINVGWNINGIEENTQNIENLKSSKNDIQNLNVVNGQFDNLKNPEGFTAAPFNDKNGAITAPDNYMFTVVPTIGFVGPDGKKYQIPNYNCVGYVVTGIIPTTPTPGISISKALTTTGTIMIGNQANFEITVKNTGDEELKNVLFRDDFGNNNAMDYLSAQVYEINNGTKSAVQNMGLTTSNGNTNTIDLVSLANFKPLNPGDSFVVDISFRAKVATCSTDIAVANATSKSGKNLNGSASASVCFTAPAASPNTGADTMVTIFASLGLLASIFGKKIVLNWLV